jgi:hypothetical protein
MSKSASFEPLVWYTLQSRETDATKRLSLDPTAQKNPVLYTFPKFIEKIMDQCQKVFSRHERLPPEAYIKDCTFRGLVWEMVELQVCSCIDA